MNDDLFDALGRGMATGAVSRRQGLKLLLAGIAGAVGRPYLRLAPAGAQTVPTCSSSAYDACMERARAADEARARGCEAVTGPATGAPDWVISLMSFSCLLARETSLRAAATACARRQCPAGTAACVNNRCCSGTDCCAEGQHLCTDGRGPSPINEYCCGGDCCRGLCCSGGTTCCYDIIPGGLFGQGAGTVDLCVDTQTNTRHCGACRHQCDDGELCVHGECVKACDPPCTFPFDTCCPVAELGNDLVCVNTTENRNHCGGCNRVCPPGQRCQGGTCVGCDPVCASNETCCGDTCVDTQTDRSNCGACGHVCPSGETCSGGACTGCPTGQVRCNGICVDTQSDPSNCGACGRVCPSGESCVGGSCQGCPAGFALCGGVCIDVRSDPLNCGSCGNSCNKPYYCGVCQNGGCRCKGSEPNGCGPCGG